MKKGLRRVAAVAVATLVVAPALATVASATSTFAFDRKAGIDRYATSVAVATEYGNSTNVILASGVPGHYPDALTASYLAGVKKAPIMLTQLAATPTNVLARIAASGATDVWLVGGEGVISAAQATALDVLYTVHRLGGLDRYLTAEKVIGEGGASATTAVLATGSNFPDAIAGGPLSYVKDMPLAITATNTLPASTLAALKAAGVTKVIALGGPTVITPAVLATLATNGIALDQRIYGANRSETSSKLADYMLASQGFTNTGINVASGYAFGTGADALGGAPLSGKENRPTLITESVTTVGPGPLGFLAAHAATLATGHIFGGLGAVSQASEDAMEAAARTGVSNQTFTVTAYAGGGALSFKYADPATASEVTDTFASTDVFYVDGVVATFGAFMAALSAGDVVTILPNTPTTGVTTYKLVNKLPADYVSGLVGNVDTTGTDYNIIEPVTGVVLGTIDYNGPNTLYSVNGTTATLAIFSANLNEGDTVVATGTGADASHVRTIALTNTTVTGTASTIVKSGTPITFFIDSAAGATLGDNPAVGTDTTGYSVTAADDTFTVDGASATFTAFGTALTVGDKISYSRAAGVQTVALVNAAPAPITGIVAEGSNLSALSYFVGSAAKAGPFDLDTGYAYILNGSVATLAEMNAAMTAGDTVKVQGGDTPTVTLTDNSLSGPMANANGTSLVDVLSVGGGVLYSALDYTVATFYTGNTSATYFVNGGTRTLAQFNTEMLTVKSGAKDGTIQVVDNGLVTEFRITTVANTASATLASVVNPGTAAVTKLDVTFSKPVYLPTADFAASDFTVLEGTTPVAVTGVTPATLANISSTVSLALSGTFGNGAVVTVTLSATGAAKVLDANGTAATAGTKSVTVAP